MKTILIAIALVLGSFATQKAHAFRADAVCTVNPAQAQCTVQNTLDVPVECVGQMRVRTYWGGFFVENVNFVVAPGTFEYAYFNAFPNDPIVGAWAVLNCAIL